MEGVGRAAIHLSTVPVWSMLSSSMSMSHYGMRRLRVDGLEDEVKYQTYSMVCYVRAIGCVISASIGNIRQSTWRRSMLYLVRWIPSVGPDQKRC